MPISTAAMLIRDPKIKVKPDHASRNNEYIKATTRTVGIMIRYSRSKNVFAPALMMPASSFMSSVPSSWFLRSLKFLATRKKATAMTTKDAK